MGFRSFEEIRAWQLAREFKKHIYVLIESTSIATDRNLRDQLREAAAGAPGHIAEGFGRFDPPDFARFVKMAKASVIECRNHLIDAVDRGHISAETRATHDGLAAETLAEMGGLIEYL